MCMHSYQPLGTDNMLLLTDYDFLDMQHFNIHRTPRFKINSPHLQASILHQSQSRPSAQTCAFSLSSNFAATDAHQGHDHCTVLLDEIVQTQA